MVCLLSDFLPIDWFCPECSSYKSWGKAVTRGSSRWQWFYLHLGSDTRFFFIQMTVGAIDLSRNGAVDSIGTIYGYGFHLLGMKCFACRIFFFLLLGVEPDIYSLTEFTLLPLDLSACLALKLSFIRKLGVFHNPAQSFLTQK